MFFGEEDDLGEGDFLQLITSRCCFIDWNSIASGKRGNDQIVNGCYRCWKD